MNFEIAVIGGGVVGTACFNKLVRLGKSVVLLEKENDVEKIREFAKIHEDEKGSFRGLPFVFRYIKK